jgi:DNA end-binding protein Ku
MPPRALLTGSLVLGLVTVPVRVYTATSSEAITFHLLHDRCGSRVQYRSFCPTCGVAVTRDELVRGFEFAKDEYVRFTEEEVKRIEEQPGRVIDVQEFVPRASVDPVYFDRTYYLGPGKGGEEAYQVLRRAMADLDRVAVAKYTMRGAPRLVLVRPVGEGFHLHTLHWADEVASFAEVERPDVAVRPAELSLAVRLIEDLAQPEFRPEQFADEYRERFLAAMERKRAGETLPTAEPQAPPPTDDLMATLKKSLELRRPPAKAGAAPPSSPKAAPGRRRRAS